MPKFTFTAPNGKAYEVEGPEGITQDQAFKVLQDHMAGNGAKMVDVPGFGRTSFPAEMADGDIQTAIKSNISERMGQLETALRNADKAGDTDAAKTLAAEIIKMRGMPAQESVASDVAKSGAAGVARGAIGMAGLPGDASDLMSRGMSWLEQKVTGRSDQDQAARDAKLAQLKSENTLGLLPTSGTIQKGVENVTGEFHKPQTTAGKYAETVGEFVPGMAMGSGGLARRAFVNAIAPGVASEAAGQATAGTAYEPWARFGGAVAGGYLAPKVLGRMATPLPIDAERKAAVDTLRSNGVEPTAGQVSGRKALRYAESALGDAPLAGGKATAATERVGEQFTDAVSKSFGGAGRATAENIDNAFNRIGGEMDNLAARHTASLDKQFITDLRGTLDDYQGIISAPHQAPAVTNYVSEIANAVKKYGNLPGDVYQSLRSRLEKSARSIGFSTPGGVETRDALRGIKSALDDAMERSIQASGNTADLGAWRTARQQYKNLLDVSRASTAAGEDAAMGLVSPGQMRSALTRGEAARRGYARGRGDLSELTRAANSVLTPLPQSGTAPRIMAQGFGPSLLASAGAAAAGQFVPAAALAAGATAPGIIGRLLMGKPLQGYLKNQALAPYLLDQKSGRAAIVNALLASPELPQRVQGRHGR